MCKKNANKPLGEVLSTLHVDLCGPKFEHEYFPPMYKKISRPKMQQLFLIPQQKIITHKILRATIKLTRVNHGGILISQLLNLINMPYLFSAAQASSEFAFLAPLLLAGDFAEPTARVQFN